jgi:glycosyltransferase involved in cell wall biosynthesis
MSKKKKLKILFHSNYSKAYTGFGKNAKNVLSYLYQTNKYDIVELANGYSKNVQKLKKMPWRCIGSMPNDPSRIKTIKEDPNLYRAAQYGSEMIDEIIKEEKPDIYIGAEDIWGFRDFWDKKWWSKINSIIWTTLDSEPIIPMAIDAAPKIKNYLVWASFASREMSKLGHNHVRTLHGAIDTENFFKLAGEYKSELQSRFKINNEDFIIGFVFRNQLRKSVPNLLEGFKIFKSQHPESGAKLLLHTSWSEGWDIPRLLKEKNISTSDILTTYHCSECGNYHVCQFFGEKQDCPYCGSESSFSTTSVQSGVSESQLNEVYNLMDVYCHPFTSGGQELPVQEAKLTELITLVTNYSCGEDCCTEESGGMPLDWSEYREPGTQFIKASTNPGSIYEQLSNVYKMSPELRLEIGLKARKYVLNNYSIDVIGPKLEKILDKTKKVKWDFDFAEEERDPNYTPPEIENDDDWLVDLYTNILKVETSKDDDGLKYWLNKLQKGQTRESVLKFFRKVAQKENTDINQKSIEDYLDGDDPNKRVIIIIKEGDEDVFLINCFLENLQALYPGDDIYVSTMPTYYPLIEDNPNCYKVLPYNEKMEDSLLLEGHSDHEGYFKVALYPTDITQKIVNYFHNGSDKNVFNIL